VLLTLSPLSAVRRRLRVRLACLIHAASVQSEPGSNSPLRKWSGQPPEGGGLLCPFVIPKESCGGPNQAEARSGRPHASSHCSVFKEPWGSLPSSRSAGAYRSASSFYFNSRIRLFSRFFPEPSLPSTRSGEELIRYVRKRPFQAGKVGISCLTVTVPYSFKGNQSRFSNARCVVEACCHALAGLPRGRFQG